MSKDCTVRLFVDGQWIFKPAKFRGMLTVSEMFKSPSGIVYMDGELKEVYLKDILFEPIVTVDSTMEAMQKTWARNDFFDKQQKEREANPVEVRYLVIHDTNVPDDSKISLAKLIDAYFEKAGIPTEQVEHTEEPYPLNIPVPEYMHPTFESKVSELNQQLLQNLKERNRNEN